MMRPYGLLRNPALLRSDGRREGWREEGESRTQPYGRGRHETDVGEEGDGGEDGWRDLADPRERLAYPVRINYIHTHTHRGEYG